MHELISTVWGRMSAAIGPHRVAASVRRGPVLWLTVCGGLLVAAIIIGAIAVASEFRERALVNGERELENTVVLLAHHFDQQLEDSEIMANDLISQMNISGIASPEIFRARMSTPAAHEMLKSRAGILSYIGEVTIFDSQGQMINSSAVWPVPPNSIADREFFNAFKSDLQSDKAVEPVRSYVTGGWTTVITRRLTGRDGVFLGVVSRRIEPASYEKFFASVVLGPGAAIAIFHRDGTLLARYPHADSMIGRKFRTAPLLQNVLTKGGRQTLRVQSVVDSQDRLASAIELSHFPMVIVATNSVAAALSDWREQTRLLILAATVSAWIIAFILYSIVGQIHRHNRESQQRLEAEKQRLDTALNNMTQGLVLYDASSRVVVCNRRYIDMYGLSTDIAKPGCHFHDLIQHRKDTGSYDGDVHEFCS
jgi:PAS domain-containing protein